MINVVSQIVSTAQGYGVDPRLALEVALRESGANPNAPDGAAGEIGIFQLMPATAAMLGVNARDPTQNIDGGVRYLSQQLAQFGDPAQALAAYNDGPGAVAAIVNRYGSDWFAHLPSSTQDYVMSILNNVNTQYGAAPGGPELSSAVAGTSFATLAWIVGAAIFVLLAFRPGE